MTNIKKRGEIAKTPRKYHSPARRRQASETRQAIVVAARMLFVRQGYAATTIDQIAAAAGCASPTVYGAFSSKAGILAALVEHASFGSNYDLLVRQQQDLPVPADRLRSAARIARTIFEAEHRESEHLLRGAAVVSPEIAAKEREREAKRFEKQKQLVDFLIAKECLKRGLKPKRAREILWALTGRELYRLLVLVQGWRAAEYENWLGGLLVDQLLEPAPRRS
jgi:AcrR family transcriptional regulator